MNFHGYIYYPPTRVWGQLLVPLAQVKKLFAKIYNFILTSIWSELISGEKIDNELINLILFFVFCGLSWLFFLFQSYRPVMLILFFILWGIDKQISHFDYEKIKHWLPVGIKLKDEKLIIKSIRPNSNVVYLEYEKGEITSSAIAPRSILSHSFQSEIDVTWQTKLFLNSGAEILINESKSPATALAQLKPLASDLNIPIKYVDSEGYHPYAVSDLNWESNRKGSAVKVEEKPNNTWHIYSQWQWRDSWRLLQEIFQRSGFLVFVIFVSRFMIDFGGFLNDLIASIGEEQIFLNFSYFGQGLTQNFGVLLYLELFLAIVLMIIEGIITSQTKHIYLDQFYIKFFISYHKQAQLKREAIEAMLFVRNPQPAVLILGKNQAIIIKQLTNQDAYRSFLEVMERIN